MIVANLIEFVAHFMGLLLAAFAIGLPIYGALVRKRLGSWTFALVIFPIVSFGYFGVAEILLRPTWPTVLPLIILGAGVLLSVVHSAAMLMWDRHHHAG